MRQQYNIKGLGALPFDKRPQKEFHVSPKPFRVPEGYDATRLDKGYDIILNNKIKGKVDFGNQVPRDNSMYDKIDKDDLLAMQKRLGKKEFNFNDYIPNSMKPKRPGSRVSLASTMIETTPSMSLSGVPGGSVMGPNGLIHNYNKNSQFFHLNDLPQRVNMNTLNVKTNRERSNSRLKSDTNLGE